MSRKLALVLIFVVFMGMLTLTFNVQPARMEVKTQIVIGTTDMVEANLDPAQAYDYFGWNIIQNIGCGLVDFRAGSTASIEDVIPALATDWSVGSDGLIWAFNIRRGVKFG